MNVDKKIIAGLILIIMIFIMSRTMVYKRQMSIDEYLSSDSYIADKCKFHFQEVVYINNEIESLYIVFFIDRLAKSHCIILEDKASTYNRLYFASEKINNQNEENKGVFYLDNSLFEFQWGIMKNESENYIDDKEMKVVEITTETAFNIETQDNLKILYFYKIKEKNKE